MKPPKLADLPQSILRHLPKTLHELEEALDVLAGLGLVTLYPDGTVGIAEEHLRQGVAVAIVSGSHRRSTAKKTTTELAPGDPVAQRSQHRDDISE